MGDSVTTPSNVVGLASAARRAAGVLAFALTGDPPVRLGRGR